MFETSIKVDETTQAADEDHDLVTACQKGDADAFGVLVAKYQKKAFNIAFRMMGDYDETADTVQEAFLSAFRSIKKFRGEAKFSTWLYGICVNQARNRLKQARRRSLHEGTSIDEPIETEDGCHVLEPADDDPPPDEQLRVKDLQDTVQECIGRLGEEFREVLVLRDIHGFSYEEIRDILDIPDGTVKSRLFRARDVLRDSLKGKIGDL